MAHWKTVESSIAGYVEVLSTERTGTAYGYRLFGAQAGPQVVVAGSCSEAEQVFDRLLAIPTLPWIRGNLVLLRLDVLDNLYHDLRSLASVGRVDEIVFLPWTCSDEGNEQLARRNFHMVLRMCTQLGMINGRGVSGIKSLYADAGEISKARRLDTVHPNLMRHF